MARETLIAESIPTTLPMTPAIVWLLREGAAAATPSALLGELCRLLVEEGMPISGAVLVVASLDPLVARRRLRWTRTDGRVVEELRLHGMMGAGKKEPIGGVGTRFHLSGTNQRQHSRRRPKQRRNLSGRTDWEGAVHEIEFFCERSTGFEVADLLRLSEVCVALTAPLQVVIARGVTLTLLQAYLGRRCAERVINGSVRRGSGELIEAVVWSSDLRDFTTLSQTLPWEQVITALNDCCARLVGAIHPLGGEVLKFIGDGLLAIFPLSPRGALSACDAALSAVRAARQGMVQLDQERTAAGLPPLPFGVGLHLGSVMYGNIGAPDRLDFTAIGPAVNVASRIEGLCRSLNCPVLISEAVAARCSKELVSIGNHPVRGVEGSVALFTLPELASGVDRPSP
ncbi:MAG TPA: adenylate/guanylate cyclase domain-containing protein [Candidatus Binataceae bacterium]|nr:adenylate/guanylate cyclase domain-containing protein [Candidatus Binataceae bacterium]